MSTKPQPKGALRVPRRVEDLPELFLQAEAERTEPLIITASNRKLGSSASAIIHIPEAAPGFDHNGLEKA